MATDNETTQNTCPRCGASHITATDARVCCPPSAEQLAARAQLPGYGFHASRVWPMRTEPTATELAAIEQAEGAASARWLAEASAEHAKTVAKVEALAAVESCGCECGGSAVPGVGLNGEAMLVHKCDAHAVRGARTSGFVCMECGHKFRTLKAAERASLGADGCPKCGGSDIDLGGDAVRGAA